MATFIEFKNFENEKPLFIQPDQIIVFKEEVLQKLNGETGEIEETYIVKLTTIDGIEYSLAETFIDFKSYMRDANMIIKEKV